MEKLLKELNPYNPIISGQLTREEIELSSKDENRPLKLKSNDIEISNTNKKIKKYVPLSKRQDKPDSALWLIKKSSSIKRFTNSKVNWNNKKFCYFY